MLRRYAKKKLDLLKDWHNKSSVEKNNAIRANNVYGELPFLALLNLLNITKGFFDSFTRYKSKLHLARDKYQLLNGFKNIGWSIYYLAVLIPLSLNSSFSLLISALKKREYHLALRASVQAVAASIGLLLNVITNIAYGLSQIIFSPLNYVASVFRYLVTYQILKKEKSFQENDGTQQLVKKGLEVLKNNSPGSQKVMQEIFEEVGRKLAKAKERQQPIQNQPINFETKVQDMGFNKDKRFKLEEAHLDPKQFNQAKELLKWLTPKSTAMPEYDYSVSRSLLN